jgi:hypothetical protein
MGRPIYIYRLAELKAIEPVGGNDTETKRISKETYQVWLSRDETTVRIVEKNLDTNIWHEVERYKAR